MLILNQKQRDQIVLQTQKEHKKNLKYEGSVRLQKGMKVYRLDTITGVIVEAEYEMQNYVIKAGDGLTGENVVRKKLMLKPNCIHAMAINEKNAKRKFIKMLQSIIKNQP